MWDEQVVLSHDKGGRVEAGEFESVTVGDGIGGTGLDAVATEDAAVVVDVIDLGVALGGGDAQLFGVLGGLDIDAVRRTGGGAEEAGDALFEAVFITLQLMLAAEALLKLRATHGTFAVRVVLDLGRLKGFLQRDAHSLGNSCDVANDGHTLSIRRRRGRLEGMKNLASIHSLLLAAGLVMLMPAPSFGQATVAKASAPLSTNLTLTIDGKATVLTVADLQAMPQKSVTVHNEHTQSDETYSGVLLGDLLAKYGFPVGQMTHRQMLRSYVVAEGTDKYWVLYSATEIEGSEHQGDVLVAVAMNGKSVGQDGQLKLVASEDKRPERWVRNLSAITLKSAE